MLVSTRGRYALRVMIDLAENRNGSYIPMKDIAERQEISQKYMEKIMSLLTKGNLVEGLHGKGGGYRLNREPTEYTIGDVLRVAEGSLAPIACLDSNNPQCEREANCRTLPMWKELDRRISEYLDSITVADLMESGYIDNYII